VAHNEADASATIELEDDSLAAGLEGVAARFEAIASQINAGFATANGQLSRTAGHAMQIGAAGPGLQAFAKGLYLAATAADASLKNRSEHPSIHHFDHQNSELERVLP